MHRLSDASINARQPVPLPLSMPRGIEDLIGIPAPTDLSVNILPIQTHDEPPAPIWASCWWDRAVLQPQLQQSTLSKLLRPVLCCSALVHAFGLEQLDCCYLHGQACWHAVGVEASRHSAAASGSCWPVLLLLNHDGLQTQQEASAVGM